MFASCSSLTGLDVSNFNTSHVTDMYSMFENCSSLINLNIGNFDMSQVVELVFSMFEGCSNLSTIIIPDKLPATEVGVIILPEVEGYYWVLQNSGSNQAHTAAIVGGKYVRVKEGTEPPTNPETPQATPEAKGTVLKAADITTTADGKIPANSTFTITSSDSKNPTVSFDGVADKNAKAVVIPKTITHNGVIYKVTTVSPKAFTSKGDQAKFKVTDNRVENLTVTYTAPTNKKKTKVNIPNYTTYKGIKFKVTKISAKAFKNNKKLKQVSIAASITDIGADAFSGCTNLKTVTIGKGLKTIGKNAFRNCKKLTKITIKSTKLKTVGKNALKGINKKCKIKVPKSKLTKYKKLFKNKGQKKSVKITK